MTALVLSVNKAFGIVCCGQQTRKRLNLEFCGGHLDSRQRGKRFCQGNGPFRSYFTVFQGSWIVIDSLHVIVFYDTRSLIMFWSRAIERYNGFTWLQNSFRMPACVSHKNCVRC